MNRDVFRQGMARMAAAVSVELTPALMATYWEELNDIDDISFLAAVKLAVRGATEQFKLPTIHALLRYTEQVRQAMGTGQPTALDAWAEFRKKVSRINLDILGHSPEVERKRLGLTDLDNVMARRLGGWAHLALMPAKDLDWKAKEFAQVYGECVERQRTEDQLVALEPARPLRTPLLAEGGER